MTILVDCKFQYERKWNSFHFSVCFSGFRFKNHFIDFIYFHWLHYFSCVSIFDFSISLSDIECNLSAYASSKLTEVIDNKRLNGKMLFVEGFYAEKCTVEFHHEVDDLYYIWLLIKDHLFLAVWITNNRFRCTLGIDTYWGCAEQRVKDECRIWQILWYPVFVESDYAVLRSVARGYPRDDRIIWCSENFLLGWFENRTDENIWKGLEITDTVKSIIWVFVSVI